jgi:hypothetical protein
MPSLFVKILLFLSSYFPLTLIFAVQLYWKNKPGLALLSLGIGALGVIGIAIYLCAVKKLNPVSISIVSRTRRDAEAMSYIVTYLLPFIVLPSSNPGDSIGLGIFLIMLCVLYVNSGMIHINPTLNLAGWHIYDVTLDSGESCTLLTRCRVRKGRQIAVVDINDGIYLEVKK